MVVHVTVSIRYCNGRHSSWCQQPYRYSYSRCTLQMDSDKKEIFNYWDPFKIIVEYFKPHSMTYSLINIHT